MSNYYLAVDIGASSGRHIVGWLENGELMTDELYRFYNGMDTVDGHLVWDSDRLIREVEAGIAECFKKYPVIESLSIDTWGVDYVLIDKDGNDIQLSTLCSDDEDNSPYSGRPDMALIDDIVDNSVETDDIEDSFLINDGDEDDDFSYEEEEAYDGFDGFDDEDNI